MARMQLGRMDVLPTHAKHVVLGAIAAAPTGLTERTIATLAWSPEIPPSRIPGLLNTYLRQGYITHSDGIYKPTMKLLRDRERWVTTRPPREVKPGALNPSRRPVTINPRDRAAMINDFLTTTDTFAAIGARYGVGKSKAHDLISSTMDREEYSIRSVERRREHGFARRTATVCRCGGPKSYTALVCRSCYMLPAPYANQAGRVAEVA